MKHRALTLSLIACFVGAGGLLLAAIIALASPHARSILPTTLFGAAALLTYVGFRVRAVSEDQEAILGRLQSQFELLRAEMEQQSSAIDTLADGLDIAIFICDARASILYANRRASDLFKWENPKGRSILAVTLSHDLEQLVFNAAKEEAPMHGEFTFAHADERVALAKVWPQSDSGQIFVSLYEITDLRRLERIRQDFVSNVSHELRTPLTIIRAMAETLFDDPKGPLEQRQKYLGKITEEVDRLSLLVNDLLVLSAAESNTAKTRACDLADIFRQVVHQLEGRASAKQLELSYEGPDNLWIEANPTQMTQIALNLVENAINYTWEGSVRVHVEREDDQALVQVMDTGIGIASEHHGRIFERFYRVDKGRSRSTGGTGLGLSIVKHIVEAHGGAVSIDSKLNQGSVFTIRLPVGTPEI